MSALAWSRLNSSTVILNYITELEGGTREGRKREAVVLEPALSRFPVSPIPRFRYFVRHKAVDRYRSPQSGQTTTMTPSFSSAATSSAPATAAPEDRPVGSFQRIGVFDLGPVRAEDVLALLADVAGHDQMHAVPSAAPIIA